MIQTVLPLVFPGEIRLNNCIYVICGERDWHYFHGAIPVFGHAKDDKASFKMITAILVSVGSCKQADIIRAFGISKKTVARNVKKLNEEGVAGFFQKRKGRGPTVMTASVLEQAQELLDKGDSRRNVASKLGVKLDTLRKTINQGRLPEKRSAECGTEGDAKTLNSKTSSPVTGEQPSDKSGRSVEDLAVATELGTACKRTDERVLASVGKLVGGASTVFEPCLDVSCGGVLCALPALAENSLFRHIEDIFSSLKGYYSTIQVIILLAYMALCRIRTVEQLQSYAPGELGKLMGLDRVPEVRCLRNKLSILGNGEAVEKWSVLLCRDWLRQCPDIAGMLYVDGHVRLYHGKQTKLPRRYVSRQRLCLRGTTDYWVNDKLGQPFFLVERPVDQGLLEVLDSEIVPRLLKDIPNQPTEQQLKSDPYLARFTIVFDREGYSPAFFKKMWQEHRIACTTYHKYPKGDWPEHEFAPVSVELCNGERVVMRLAERGSWIGERRDGLWVREVRKLSDSGHQTSLVSTAYGQLGHENAVGMFSRWSQENFFRYAIKHYGIDLLSEYGTEEIPGTKRPVVNPVWRQLDNKLRALRGKLTKIQARFGALVMKPEADISEVPQWKAEKEELVEQIERLERDVTEMAEQKRTTDSHILWSDLPEKDQFPALAAKRKHLMDTIKMIAYRAETAITAILREKLAHYDEGRTLVLDLFQVEADILPDLKKKLLNIRVHPMSNPRNNLAIQHLLSHLNDAEMNYPGTDLLLRYSLLGAQEKNSLG